MNKADTVTQKFQKAQPMIDCIKAELHVHLEGTLSPQNLCALAIKNNVALPKGILNSAKTSYNWENHDDAGESLMSFVQTYDRATAVIQTPQDYYDITLDYLRRCADLGSIYEELTIYANPEPVMGLSYGAMLGALSDAIDTAREKHDIECRLLASFVRHFGIDRALKDAKTVVANPHKYVTGITMAGAETAHKVSDFVPAYNIVTEALDLQKTAHAGEATGAETIRACYELLGITRFGHMVRVIEDPDLMAEMADIGAVAEVCPSSNMALKVFKNIDDHPLRKMYDAGIKITLASDDPPFFDTDINQEYKIAANDFGFTKTQLLSFTQNALDAAFVDSKTKQRLLTRLLDNT